MKLRMALDEQVQQSGDDGCRLARTAVVAPVASSGSRRSHVDARGNEVRFDALIRRTSAGVSPKRDAGWPAVAAGRQGHRADSQNILGRAVPKNGVVAVRAVGGVNIGVQRAEVIGLVIVAVGSSI